jgi:hypothetical protein
MEHRVDTQLWAAPHFGGTERLREALPSVQDCNYCANRCLDMWNDSVDHAARSSLLRMADAWLQLAGELAKRP